MTQVIDYGQYEQSDHRRTSINFHNNKSITGVFRKIADAPKPCLDPAHNPPAHIALEPGAIYKYICPSCGSKSVISSPIIL